MLVAGLLCVNLALVSFGGGNIWADLKAAAEYEAANQLNQAAPLWISSLDYFIEQDNEDAWNNAALMAKKTRSLLR